MKILVTGSDGYIGTALCEKLKVTNDVVMLDKSYPSYEPIYSCNKSNQTIFCDILNLERLKCINDEYKPNKIIHCAANKYIQECEKNPDLAIDNNIIGTQNIVKAFPKASIVLISTDKAVNPSTTYGYSKAICEKIVLKHTGISTIFRLGNVLHSTGSVLEKWEQSGDTITVYKPNGCLPYRYFISLNDCVNFIIGTKLIDKSVFIPKMSVISIDYMAKEFAVKHNKKIKYQDVKNEKIYESLFNDLEANNIKEYSKYYRCDYYRNDK